MRTITFLTALCLFLTACNQQSPLTATQDQIITPEEQAPIEDYWAKDNFNLQRVGNLLERSDSPQEFESYLNNDDGINNLDLNGDGYVDYISVEEFEDRGDHERGLSLYSRYGPDQIQEIAEIFFYREDPYAPGAVIYIRGDERIYGDDYYYETNWLDRTIALVTFVFSPHEYYHSPYYYDYYPPDYVVYEVVETPVYITRVERLYPEPVFVFTAAPTFIDRIKIKSPNQGRHLGQVYAKLAKPTREQEEFVRNNPVRPKPGQVGKVDRQPGVGGPEEPGRVGRPDQPGQPGADRPDQPGRPEKGDRPGQPDKSDRPGRPEQPRAPKPDAPASRPPRQAQPERPAARPPQPPAKAPAQGQAQPKGGGQTQPKGGGQGKGKKP